LAVDAAAVPHYSWHDGLLRYKNRIWVGSDIPLQTRLIEAFHSMAVGGHLGIPVTYARLKQLFAWRGMKKSCSGICQSMRYVSACEGRLCSFAWFVTASTGSHVLIADHIPGFY
jgi:hypothetical protein